MLNRLREMMGEEPELPATQAVEPEEIPEETPFYLNPEVLAREEEHTQAPESKDEKEPSDENILAHQPPEKIETVLNSGMQFIAGLMEMATGKKVETSDTKEKMIRIDKDTGEVTMKFKLPGF